MGLILRERIGSGGLEHRTGGVFPSLLRTVDQLWFHAPALIGLKPLAPSLRPCLQGPLMTPGVGGDRASPQKEGGQCCLHAPPFQCVVLNVWVTLPHGGTGAITGMCSPSRVT